MASGICTGWKEDRGFGFLRPDHGGPDVFVHRRDIGNALWLTQGQRVTFEVVDDARSGKPRADNVRVL
jgi:CspA family cold shock protein